MRTYTVEVTRVFKITLDESKFTPEFFEEFNASIINNFGEDEAALDEHAMHLGFYASREVYVTPHEFVEGYGNLKDMGIKIVELPVDDVEITNVEKD